MKAGRKSEYTDDTPMSTSPTKKQRRRPTPRTSNRGESSREKNHTSSKATASTEQKSSETDSLRAFSRLSLTSEAPARRGWPENQIPIEIFDEIISYLPRSNVKSMRLVNKEFEKKVSGTFFQVVVVPFKPEIYGIAPDPPLGGPWAGREEELPQGAIMLQDKGMRVFHGFGGKIKKFAMSFEFEEEKLARPPTKDDQQAITTFWGIYPWPYTKYNRYAHLEGLEQTADETKTMARAFRHITRASELGLSMDGGLGFLNGPDVNLRVFERAKKPSVFGKAKYVPEPMSSSSLVGRHTAPLPVALSVYERRYQECERMCIAAGYTGDELGPAVHILLQNDHVPQSWTENANCRPFQESLLARLTRHNDQLGVLNFDPDEVYNADDDEVAAATLITAARRAGQRNRQRSIARFEVFSLKPSELTIAQREMLLEIEWAQRAFVQSYTIAIIDNAGVFNNIQKLTISRLPSRHIHMIRREDFWDALPNLEQLSLAIIPDWRDVVKEPTGWVQDVKVVPSLAVAGVHQLLQEQISGRKNITTLHLEWLCGGEYSPGMFSRNQHVLPAPIVSIASNMVNRTEIQTVLELPHVKHISLKNCWAAPHIWRRFLAGLQRDGTETLTFDSVSLTANIPQGVQPGPQQLHQPHQAVVAAAAHLMNAIAPAAGQQWQAQPPQAWQPNAGAANGLAVQQPPAVVPMPLPFVNSLAHPIAVNPPPPPAPIAAPIVSTNGEPDWLQPPRYDSWVSIINDFTPNQTLEHIRWVRDFSEEPELRPHHNFKKLDFTSCGYVHLPLDFDQHLVPNPLVPTVPPGLTKKMSDLEASMMKANDHMLGKVTNCIHPREINALQNAFNLTVGWLARDQGRAELVLDCEADGVMVAGHGRFDGIITAGQTN